MSVDVGEQARLIQNDAFVVSHPQRPPDGETIVFEQDSQIFVMNADGSSPRQLTEGGTALRLPLGGLELRGRDRHP